MGISKRISIPILVAGSMTLGGIGGMLINTVAHAATTDTSASTSAVTTAATSTTAQPSGTFKPNEDLTHEAVESAAGEAQENAGQRPKDQ